MDDIFSTLLVILDAYGVPVATLFRALTTAAMRMPMLYAPWQEPSDLMPSFNHDKTSKHCSRSAIEVVCSPGTVVKKGLVEGFL